LTFVDSIYYTVWLLWRVWVVYSKTEKKPPVSPKQPHKRGWETDKEKPKINC